MLLIVGLPFGATALQQSLRNAQRDEQAGSIESFVVSLKDRMPRRGSEAYVVPTQSDVEAMKLVLDKVNEWLRTAQDGKLAEAAALAAQMKYRVMRFNDPSMARVFIVLLEDSSVNRGWGTYLFYVMPNGQYRNLLIEVPHPLFDVNTPK